MQRTPYEPTHDEASAKLAASYLNYLATLERLSSIQPCPSFWPSDPPGPGYEGTRCDLMAGHDTGPHRHRIRGSQTVVEW